MKATRLGLSVLSCALLLRAGALPAAGPLDEVVALLAGTFDSRDQALADPGGFREIRMVSVVVPRSRLGFGAPVLYVEQALAATPDKPYRQRFYVIQEGDAGGVVSRAFEPKDPIALSGKWRDPADLALFGPNDVMERRGCAVELTRVSDRWVGSTRGSGCPSNIQGARYATSEVEVLADRLVSWDRGYDQDGRQVWGATKGPYVFMRRSSGPPVTAPAAPTPNPTATPTPKSTSTSREPALAEPSLPPQLLAREVRGVLVRGVEEDRRFSEAEIRGLPSVTRKVALGSGKKLEYTGVPLADLLRRAGLHTEGMAARRLLAPAVVVATARDGYVAAFAAEELLGAEPPLLVWEVEDRPLPPDQGPFRIVAPGSDVRSIWGVTTLELRLLASNRPEEDRGER